MSNDSIYKVYLKGMDTWVDVSKEFYYEYYRPIWRIRKNMQEKNVCRCPKDRFHLCDGICCGCEFYGVEIVSLDQPIGDGNICLGDTLFDENDTPEKKCIQKETIAALYAAIEKLPETEKTIIYLLLEGKTGDEIRSTMGFRGLNNVSYWKKKAYTALRELMEPYH